MYIYIMYTCIRIHNVPTYGITFREQVEGTELNRKVFYHFVIFAILINKEILIFKNNRINA